MNKTSLYIIGAVAAIALIAGGSYGLRKKTMNTNNNNNGTSHENSGDYYDVNKPGSRIPLGYRQNNPLNIRYSASNAWRGKLPNNGSGYECFVSMPYGFRAALVLLRKYIKSDKLDTIRKMIYKWAPPSDNNATENYISHVSSWSGIPQNQVLNPDDPNTMIPIAYAMARSENGYFPLMSDVKEGWNLI